MTRKKVETKKAVIFIVEGRSDKKALENIDSNAVCDTI